MVIFISSDHSFPDTEAVDLDSTIGVSGFDSRMEAMEFDSRMEAVGFDSRMEAEDRDPDRVPRTEAS